MLLAARWHARRSLDRFLNAARHAVATQQRVLLDKVRRNAASGFGDDHGFQHIHSYEDFVCRVPVCRYEDLEPYVERVKAGDIRALFGPRQHVLMFAKTSGTTDRPKYIPVTRRFLDEYRAGWNAFGVKALLDHPGSMLRNILQVSSPMDEERSAAGIPCGAITGLMAATQKRLVRKYYVTPRSTAYIADAEARYYTVMRCAIPRDVVFMVTASPATQLRLARTAEQHADRLIRDVADGTLSSSFELPPAIRADIEARLRPDRQAAARLERIASSTGRFRPQDYWRLGFLANWTGGTMGLYLGDFQEFFGDTPVRDIGLLASEGRMSIPIEDGTPAGILDVASNFYEFIPADEYESESPTVLRGHELTVGAEYFILLTTSAGFYRYDIGDRVRVTGFYGEAPLIEFLHKGVHTSSLTGEKLTERQVVLAFERAAKTARTRRQNFVLAPQWGDPPHYRLHLEGEASEMACPAALAEEFERQLQQINIEYASKRTSERLGPVELNLLPPGWLTGHDRECAELRGRANEQYKHRYLYSALEEDAAFPRMPAPGVGATG